MISHQPLLETPRQTNSSCKRYVSLILSIAAIISSTSLFLIYFNQTTLFSAPSFPTNVCDKAQDKDSCLAMVLETDSTAISNKPITNKAHHILQKFLEQTFTQVEEALEMAKNVNNKVNNPKVKAGLVDCVKMMDSSLDRVKESIKAFPKGTLESYEDVHIKLSCVFTNHIRCLDGLVEGSVSKTIMELKLRDLILRARTSLALLLGVGTKSNKLKERVIEFPTWVTDNDRSLLMENSVKVIKANITVAQDGSGNYKTVQEAVYAAPNHSKSRFVIHVKKGIYMEKVEVGKNKKNLMLVGDGLDKTLISGSLNVHDKTPTFDTATVGVAGDGFIAQDIWFQNLAGPQKDQAVALLIGGDKSVINRCRIDGYQDSLCAYCYRQFYRESIILGTVDFIFGEAVAVFQNCTLIAKKPGPGQQNMVTAQGKEDPNQKSGFSIQQCNIIPDKDLKVVKGSVQSFLGRPWKRYSTTVVMESFIDDFINSKGWSEWNKTTIYRNTLYFGEYGNKGGGAGLGQRVNWPGYHNISNPAEAKKFTVKELLLRGASRDNWLKSTGVAYTEGL